MQTLVPVIRFEDILNLKGVYPETEFYAGFELETWKTRFGTNEDMNRMSAFHFEANTRGMDEIKSMARVSGLNPLYITLNAASYSSRQLNFLHGVVSELKDANITGIIVGDPFLAEIVIEHGLRAVASTMIGVYNADIAKWCRDIGFSRIILPRDLTLQEISDIVRTVPEIEYECFLMRNGCRYSDANCLAKHKNKYGALCTYLDRARVTFEGVSKKQFTAHNDMAVNHHVYTNAFHKSACGMCAIWRMKQIGITAGKVVGRADGIKSIEEDLKILKENIEIAERCATEEEYLKKMRFPRRYDAICYEGMNCYYPEVRYKGS